MSALMGSLTYVRLFVEGEVAADFRERFLTALRLHAMKPLTAEDDLAERSGWCAFGDPNELELAAERVFLDGYVHLGFRTDRWSIPVSQLRAEVRAAEAAHLAAHGRTRLSKREHQEIKERVLRQLRGQSAPSVRAFDLSWSLEEQLVRFFGNSQRAIPAMIELFRTTFGSQLVPEAPFTLAARLGLGAEEEPLWDALEPTLLGTAEV